MLEIHCGKTYRARGMRFSRLHLLYMAKKQSPISNLCGASKIYVAPPVCSATASVPYLEDGEVLIKNLYLSVDPAQVGCEISLQQGRSWGPFAPDDNNI